MYEDVGKKIKGLAKATFIVETIAAIITGFALMATDYDAILTGLLVVVIGPIAAWVSSWVLYGFGELIDKASEIAENTSPKSKSFSTKNEVNNLLNSEKVIVSESDSNAEPPNMLKRNWPCPNCGKIIETDTCAFCGYTESHNNAPYWCGRCGHNGPYGDICPNCNSSMKLFNVHYKE